ncbi:PREDICTED: odorant receptor 13a-like [Trachymyrmex cornetzi]|uniref:odorant receptor 13a-like n=1 Tax=Trachymyrmex cornetzi TaxID=471704 RepID=UPI00084F02F4|nr:PREDICTED: odorant receptor 13a-like [Trachymyrmex cornetzi]
MITSSISPALKVGLQFLGMWPGNSYSTIHWLSFMLSMLIIQYFQYLYIFGHLKMSELSNLVDGLIVALDYSLTLFKLTSLWAHRRVFHKILAVMDNDWRECINVDKHLYLMTIKANVARFTSNILLSVNAVVAVLYLLGDYVIRFVFFTDNQNDTLRQLPIKIQFPFETQQSPTFEFLVVTLFLHVAIHACTIAILNGLMLTLVLHISGQIDIMCHEFRNISKGSLLHGSFESFFGLLIEKHNKIILFSNNIETLFSFIALMQVVWNTLVICCLGFIIIISIYNETGIFVLVKTVSGYFVIMIEAFVICFAGEYLSLKGKSIANAIYESLWYDIPSNKNKIIVFIIMRSQKRLTITAGKMMDMSLETFTRIMKASASYVSVLNAMY